MGCGAGKSQDSIDKVLNDSVCNCSCKLTAHNVQATVCTCVFQLQGSSALVAKANHLYRNNLKCV